MSAGDLAAELTEELTGAAGDRLSFGDERVLSFFDALGRRMLRPGTVRAHPELVALGFFLRRGALGSTVTAVTASRGLGRVAVASLASLVPLVERRDQDRHALRVRGEGAAGIRG